MVRQAKGNGVLQKGIPVALRVCIQYGSPYLNLAGQPRKLCFNGRMRIYFFWQHFANDLDKTLKKWYACLQARSKIKFIGKLQHFPAVRPLELVLINIYRPVLEMQLGNQHSVIMTNLYAIRTCVIPTEIITVNHLVTLFLYNLILLYGDTNYELTYEGPTPSANT